MAESRNQGGGVDPVRLVHELQEQENRRREYEARRLAAQLQHEALKTEQEQELMRAVKEKQEPHTQEKLDRQELESNPLGRSIGRAESEFDRETEKAIQMSLSEAQAASGSFAHHVPWRPPGPGGTHEPTTASANRERSWRDNSAYI